ncbi:hypothetical protein, partial [Burkholderia cenocepacia]|uniref:hypothetical protein n=1 Tax=Burkholderia cenocepacia TaxID=95486 RepID=UPI001C0BEF8D
AARPGRDRGIRRRVEKAPIGPGDQRVGCVAIPAGQSFHQLLRETPPLMAGRKGVQLTGSFFHGLGSPA